MSADGNGSPGTTAHFPSDAPSASHMIGTWTATNKKQSARSELTATNMVEVGRNRPQKQQWNLLLLFGIPQAYSTCRTLEGENPKWIRSWWIMTKRKLDNTNLYHITYKCDCIVCRICSLLNRYHGWCSWWLTRLIRDTLLSGDWR